MSSGASSSGTTDRYQAVMGFPGSPSLGTQRTSLWSGDFFRCESILLKSYWIMVVQSRRRDCDRDRDPGNVPSAFTSLFGIFSSHKGKRWMKLNFSCAITLPVSLRWSVRRAHDLVQAAPRLGDPGSRPQLPMSPANPEDKQLTAFRQLQVAWPPRLRLASVGDRCFLAAALFPYLSL